MASTSAPHALYGLYALILPKLKTAKNGGIVGDASHGSGYHLSRDALKARGLSGDYSIQCPADKRGPGNLAAAVDITFGSLDELITVHKRLKAACEKNDPRVAIVRETIGTVDGKNVSGWNRVATGSGSRSVVGWHSTGWSDKSHLWHEHISILRDQVENANGIKGLAEVILGLAAGALGWVGESGSTPVVTPPVVTPPVVVDPKEFPGAAAFFVGARGDFVTLLGQRLVAHGWTGYSDGPGPLFTDVDKAAVLDFQVRQGWTGASATGIPGPATWARLMADPAPVVVPPVVTPPTTTPEDPSVKGITTPVQFISLNAEWPEFGSTQAKVKAGKVKSWSTRKGILAGKIKASRAKVIAVQELGQAQAADLAEALGKDWAYQRLTLNCVFWRTDTFDHVKTRELVLPAFGQFPGRSYVEVWLKDKKGNRLRVGSTHLTVKTASDEANQKAQIQKVVSFANDEVDDAPLVIGIDTNNKQAGNAGMWAVLKEYGYEWDRNGIDAILWNFGVKIPGSDRFDLGDGSDHDGRTALLTTNKK